MDFKDKTVIITGSARGIGRTIAAEFVSRGAHVVISDIDDAACQKTATELGPLATGIKANVMSSDDIEQLFQTTLAKFGHVDVVVNNAGITRDTLLVRMDEKDWDLVLDINLKGSFLVTKVAAKVMMKQRSGRIINISSVVGLIGNAGQANYSASKAGLIGLTMSAAKELAPRGVTVNAIAPGYIATEMTEHLPEAAKEAFLKKVCLGRPGTPTDVAGAVLFFASDQSAYITGQVLAVDGGLTIS